MAVDDIVTLRLVGRYQAQNIVNTLHYRITVQVTDQLDILAALVTEWSSTLVALWLARCSDAYELIGLKAFRKTGDPMVPAYLQIGTAGDVIAAGLPSSVGRVITLYTDSANYRRRGRIQMSGTCTDMLNTTDGAVTDVERDLVQDLATDLHALVEAPQDSFQMCIPPTDVLPYEDVTAVRARTTPSLTKSRRVRNFLIG